MALQAQTSGKLDMQLAELETKQIQSVQKIRASSDGMIYNSLQTRGIGALNSQDETGY